MYTENDAVMKRNETVLKDLPRELYTIQANNKIVDNHEY